MIVIIDYGMGNVGSIKNMIYKLGSKSIITSDVTTISNAEKIILPGVGAFDEAIKNLKDLQLIEILKKKVVDDKVPILGICLGMQLMTKKSQEGFLEGLGFIDAETIKFDFSGSEEKLKIPHMGWNNISIVKSCPLATDLLDNSRFYFVHSYYVKCNNEEDVLFKCNYGINFCASFMHENIIGVQFHPEKSHKFGLALLRNFIQKI